MYVTRSTASISAAHASATTLMAGAARTRARSRRRGHRGHRCRDACDGARGRGRDELESAVEMLDQRGAALDPVAAVAVEDGANRAQRRLVDVSAHDSGHPAPRGLVHDGGLER